MPLGYEIGFSLIVVFEKMFINVELFPRARSALKSESVRKRLRFGMIVLFLNEKAENGTITFLL